MINIKKKITLTVSDEDFDTLSNVCELARQYIDRAKENEEPFPGGYDEDQIKDGFVLINKVFDETN